MAVAAFLFSSSMIRTSCCFLGVEHPSFLREPFGACLLRLLFPAWADDLVGDGATASDAGGTARVDYDTGAECNADDGVDDDCDSDSAHAVVGDGEDKTTPSLPAPCFSLLLPQLVSPCPAATLLQLLQLLLLPRNDHYNYLPM